jgi:hypothetical protein
MKYAPDASSGSGRACAEPGNPAASTRRSIGVLKRKAAMASKPNKPNTKPAAQAVKPGAGKPKAKGK